MKKALIFFLLICSCRQEERLNKIPAEIEATYMQYACGNWNDDMKVKLVNDTTFNFLLGNDIDPLILNGKDDISGWLYHNQETEFGMTYRMKGYLSVCALSGCDNGAPKFWITHIERKDGSEFEKQAEN